MQSCRELLSVQGRKFRLVPGFQGRKAILPNWKARITTRPINSQHDMVDFLYKNNFFIDPVKSYAIVGFIVYLLEPEISSYVMLNLVHDWQLWRRPGPIRLGETRIMSSVRCQTECLKGGRL